ncbi:uncharacterized protein LJ206_011541 isoform 2-T2 [Theristicus caerulescens]
MQEEMMEMDSSGLCPRLQPILLCLVVTHACSKVTPKDCLLGRELHDKWGAWIWDQVLWHEVNVKDCAHTACQDTLLLLLPAPMTTMMDSGSIGNALLDNFAAFFQFPRDRTTAKESSRQATRKPILYNSFLSPEEDGVPGCQPGYLPSRCCDSG